MFELAPATLWAIGLSRLQEDQLRTCLADQLSLLFLDLDSFPGLEEVETYGPCSLWLSSEAMRKMIAGPPGLYNHLDLIPKILFLDQNYTLEDYELASDLGISEVVRPPISTRRVREVLRHSLETRTLHADLLSLTREMSLERDALERKNTILSFLVDFLHRTSQAIEVEDVLQATFSSLNRLLPVRAMGAALWPEPWTGGPAKVSLKICAGRESRSYSRWRDALLEQTAFLTRSRFLLADECRLELGDQHHENIDCSPENGYQLCLPLTAGMETVGVLVLVTEEERAMHRDQAEALEQALGHLGQTLKKNADLRNLQSLADCDQLTGIHNRRHFEHRLLEELDRFQRYQNPLSLIMVDVDHFKAVNDTLGHQAGDAVLQEVASTIHGAVRASDYCARYGGEEFILLLPHTNSGKAFALAERLRHQVEESLFARGKVRLTISLGLTTLESGMHKDGKMLLREADQALYQAKNGGRNRTMEFAEEPGRIPSIVFGG